MGGTYLKWPPILTFVTSRTKCTLTAFHLKAMCQPFEQLCYPLARNINPFKRLRHPFVRNFNPFERLVDPFITSGHPFVEGIRPFEQLHHSFVKDNRPFERLGHPYYGILWNYFFCLCRHGRRVMRWATFAKYKCRNATCSKYFTCSSGQLIQCLKDLFDFICTSFSAFNCFFFGRADEELFSVDNSLSDNKSNLKISHVNKTFQKKSKHFPLPHTLEMKYFWAMTCST